MLRNKYMEGYYQIMPDKDGTGPREGSYMYRTGHKGKKAGHQQGNCK